MDGTAVIKVEEDQYENSCCVDPWVSSPITISYPSLLQENDCKPVKIETTIENLAVKSKRKQSLEKHLLRSFEESESSTQDDTLQTQTSLIKDKDVRTNQCQLCISLGKESKHYANKTSLVAHINTVHSSTGGFKCEFCPKEFKFLSNLIKHSRGHLDQTLSLKCVVCSVTFSTMSHLNTHLVRVHKYSSDKLNVKQFPCDLCTNAYFCKSVLERHVVEAHVVDKPHECHVCSKTFIDQEALSKHLKDHDVQSRHVCDVCSKAFKHKKALLHHLGVVHHRFFHCKKCKKSFSNKSKFDAHSDLQQEIKNGCQICNATFPSQCRLSHHIELHNSSELQNQDSDEEDQKIKNSCDEFKCELCSKTFDREAYIVAHRLLVHRNSQWPCSKCSKTFKVRYKMKQHELTHQEVKPHQCKLCDQSFCSARELIVHESNKHSNRKHFKCQICPESFATFNTLKSHMANCHGGEKPFKCHVCTASFVSPTYLKKHLVSHRTQHLFSCESCSKSFKDLEALRGHARRAHRNNSAKKQDEVRRRPESLMFACHLCSFKTRQDRQIAVHYNDHGLPKVTLHRIKDELI